MPAKSAKAPTATATTKPPKPATGKNGQDKPAPTKGTKADFARYMNVPQVTIRSWADAGKLAFNPDGTVNFEQSKVLLERLKGVGMSTTYDRARARERREQYEAEQARLDLEERQGRLVQSDAVVRATSTAGATVRATAETMPHRLAPQLSSAAGDEDRCRAILTEWVEQFLTECSASFASIASAVRKKTTQ